MNSFTSLRRIVQQIKDHQIPGQDACSADVLRGNKRRWHSWQWNCLQSNYKSSLVGVTVEHCITFSFNLFNALHCNEKAPCCSSLYTSMFLGGLDKSRVHLTGIVTAPLSRRSLRYDIITVSDRTSTWVGASPNSSPAVANVRQLSLHSRIQNTSHLSTASSPSSYPCVYHSVRLQEHFVFRTRGTGVEMEEISLWNLLVSVANTCRSL